MKCLDLNCYFSIQARSIIRKHRADEIQDYYSSFPEESTIIDIWNGVFATGRSDWHYHNFTIENVINAAYEPVRPLSGMVFAGDDKMYFIGSDGYIHGYILASKNHMGGTWLTVSPSYAAQVPASTQIKAKSDLVASPDGRRLLYIGTDGYIHGFDITDAWRYSYIYSTAGGDVVMPGYHGPFYDGFFRKPMMDQNITAVGGLIYPGHDRIFYIGKWAGDGSQYIHCFQKSAGYWQTNSPSYAADGIHHQPIAGQFQAGGGLAYDWHSSRLYYRTIHGHLAYYEVRSLLDFYYVACPGNFLLHDQSLKIVGNLAVYRNRVYYVGYHGPTKTYYVHCLVDNGGGVWNTVSPSYSAAYYGHTPIGMQMQADSAGEIAVSPDGNTIAYIGSFIPGKEVVYYFTKKSDIDYSYHKMPSGGITTGDRRLQFRGNDHLFYLSVMGGGSVHRLVFHEAYCENRFIDQYERG